MTPAELIEEHIKLDDYLKAEAKRFMAFMKPHKERMEQIENELLAVLNAMYGQQTPEEQARASFSCDAGTAYKSNILNVKIDVEAEPYNGESGRDALLSYALDNWDSIGNELLLYQPQKDAVKKHMEEHDGKPPPGIKIGWFTRVNIRRS